MAVLSSAEILCAEAQAIHGHGPDPKDAALFVKLNELESTALCLSGGGIRSAAFALGVIQAFAARPRSTATDPLSTTETSAAKSLLAQFRYLSTVSGGGYIGSWLSAWRTEQPFSQIWQRLVARPEGPNNEPSQLSWLRSYSNYLTPKVGITSADTWAAVNLALRNLLLNWLVLISPLCAGVLLLKLFGLLSIWIAAWGTAPGWEPGSAAGDAIVYVKMVLELLCGIAGVVCLVRALALMTRDRPSRRSVTDRGIDEARYLRGPMAWSALSAILLVQWLASDLAGNLLLQCKGDPHRFLPFIWLCTEHGLAEAPGSTLNIARYPLIAYEVVGAAIGALLYWMSWKIGNPQRPSASDRRKWTASGAVYGTLVALGLYVYLIIPDQGVANLPVYYLHLVFLIPWVLLSEVLSQTVFVGLASHEPESEPDREWFGRAAGWLVSAAVIWLILLFLVCFGAIATTLAGKDLIPKIASVAPAITVISGLVTALFGTSRLLPVQGGANGTVSYLIALILPIVALLFVATLVIFISSGFDSLLFGGRMINVPPDKLSTFPWAERFLLLIGAFAVAAAFAGLASNYVNINRFSLHAIYRNRLVRAFLGASRKRAQDRFTGFDEGDNRRMTELWTPPEKDNWRPFHVINIALNVVSSAHLSWQERKAEPFTVSALHSGGDYTGYRDSGVYGDPKGISLGTAMAISGAAASPNMGYHSSPAITFLMTMFNVRLGWWLGNPGPAGDATFSHEGPWFAIQPLVEEALGRTTDNRPYVYLSDGGHFENLGLYEMVRRRCRYIVVSDAGCDPDFVFEDLANAVRKIAIDLGVTVRFRNLENLKPRPKDGTDIGPGRPYHAIAEIDYQAADGAKNNGIVLYIKAGYHGVESAGLRGYALANPDFPHQPTADQWFTESQFESYRALGFETTDGILQQAISTLPPTTAPTLANVFVALLTGGGAGMLQPLTAPAVE